MERRKLSEKIELVGLKLACYNWKKRHITNRLPVVKTVEIGHGSDSKAIMIGEKMKFAKG